MKNKRIIAFISREVRLHKVNDHVSPLWGTVYPLVQNSHQHYMETSVLENIIVCLTELSINYNYKELVRRWHWYPTTRLRCSYCHCVKHYNNSLVHRPSASVVPTCLLNYYICSHREDKWNTASHEPLSNINQSINLPD
jgi:hypothetical protein